MVTELIWQHLDAPGWEHVRIIEDHPGWTVFDSILVREHQGQVLRGGYTLVIDKSWRTLELRLMLESAPGSMEGIHLLTEGDGRWTDANEQHIPELDGCMDVDIQWTPLTKSLPINRLGIEQGGEHSVPVAYISLPNMTIEPTIDHYQRTGSSKVTHTSSRDRADQMLSIDRDGLVSEIAQRFLRTTAR